MNSFYVRKAGEVGSVEGEDLSDAVDDHRGGEFSVVNLDAADLMLEDKSPPFHKDLQIVRQQRHVLLEKVQSAVGGFRCQALAVPGDGAGRYIPELGRVLQSEVELNAAILQASNRGLAEVMSLGIKVKQAQQDIRIDQAVRLPDQSCSS
jgi:hypothetical protein